MWHQKSKLSITGPKPAAKPSEGEANKYKTKNNNKPTCTLRSPGKDMNSFKVMPSKAKYTKGTCYSAHGGGVCFKFTSAKNYSSNGEELNMLVSSAVANAMKTNKKSKAKDTSDSENDNESEYLNFEHLKIGSDSNYKWGKIRKERTSQPKLCVKCTFNQNEFYSISKIIKPAKNRKPKCLHLY